MTVAPEFMPLLSRGKHRSPKSGGCFMEIASFLAGDPWSDHPKCTDPALAELGRCVNDVLPDSARSQLSALIPSVIGTGGGASTDRRRIAAMVVRECSLVALPLVTAKTRPLACALLVAEQVLDVSTRDATAVLATQPDASTFARRFLHENPSRWQDPRAYLSLAVPQAVRCAVLAVSEELGDDAPDLLLTMLTRAIGAVRAACGLVDEYDIPPRQWQKACQLVGEAKASAADGQA